MAQTSRLCLRILEHRRWWSIALSLRVASRLKFNFIALHIKKELLQQFQGSDLTHL